MSSFEALVEQVEWEIATNQGFFERHAREGKPVFFLNASTLIKATFELGLLHWARGDVGQTVQRFGIAAGAYRSFIETYRRLRDRPEISQEFASGLGSPERLARLAGYFVGDSLSTIHSETPAPEEEPGYELWFEQTFTNACVEGVPIDAAKFERSKQLYTKRRSPAAKLVEWDFYREVLEGGWRSRDPNEMLRHHESLYAKRAKKNGDLLSGEGQFNTLVVDYMFAGVLKKIGWRGRYRHAWPEDGIVLPIGASPQTSTPPSSFLKRGEAQAMVDKPATLAAATADEAVSRIDPHLRMTGELSSVLQSAKQQQDAVAALQKLGVDAGSDFAKLTMRYRLSALDSHNVEAGPLADAVQIAEMTEHFRKHCSMSDRLLMLSTPVEVSDWEAPEGGWFVYSRAEGKVYLADVDHLPDLSQVKANAQPSVSEWPSFASFLLWYLKVPLQA